MNPVSILLILLWSYAVVFVILLLKDIFTNRRSLNKNKLTQNIVISGVSNFFDTLGIGSFGIVASLWKFTKSIPDSLIPGTLNTAFAIPTVVEASIYIHRIEMDIPTLALMIASSVIGASIGAGIIAKLNITKIRLTMGIALLAISAVTLCRLNAAGPFGIIGTAKGLDGRTLIAAVIGNFVLGALMPAGIGLYAPCMALVLLLGMSADAAFPVMMGSCAFLMPSAGITFIKEGRYHRGAALPMAFAGVIGVLAASSLVTALPLTLLAYLACFVMILCAGTFFHDAWKSNAFRFKSFKRKKKLSNKKTERWRP